MDKGNVNMNIHTELELNLTIEISGNTFGYFLILFTAGCKFQFTWQVNQGFVGPAVFWFERVSPVNVDSEEIDGVFR